MAQPKPEAKTSAPPKPSAARRLACARCGTAFDCSLGGGCWCADEPYRLPMPDSAAQDSPQDCLCPACLRAAAAAAGKSPAP
ncbi:MAG TPA: cysteine-rich CWC family protein [Xanthobacteraceae bacterium]|nr:cysteine-rich CWC family protein [Xanthobacteraceae bacterium]